MLKSETKERDDKVAPYTLPMVAAFRLRSHARFHFARCTKGPHRRLEPVSRIAGNLSWKPSGDVEHFVHYWCLPETSVFCEHALPIVLCFHFFPVLCLLELFHSFQIFWTWKKEAFLKQRCMFIFLRNWF